uniref:Phosphatidylinositol-glycan biosynthesis class W protein n=1 Tax=Odontella aurita TaxID=265563 RepID=A0A7S4JVF4_9STRA|mmetsp:Transcript_545/g.1663  ORF Transcript_545/g.1663 Transcript_545/m.1663 type:complete len:491 (+) Transcript_545:335-1807(+)
MTPTLKEQKEAFVTGHEGSTPLENFLVCLSSPVGIFLFNELRQNIISSEFEGGSRNPKSRGTRAMLVVLESVVLLFPMAICQTTLLHSVGVPLIFLEFLLGILLAFFRLRAPNLCGRSPAESGGVPLVKDCGGEPKLKPRLEFLTSYRSSVSYLTFVAILAVDFRIFPRKFAKTETVGYGLMDLGAGSFIVAGGLVSPSARHDQTIGKDMLVSTMIRLVPLVLLGVVRLATNKGIEYQEHASEYGVHWNFFFTLASVSFYALVSRLASARKNRTIIPISLLLMYQFALSKKGLQSYIENAPRICSSSDKVLCSFFAANREGLLGCIGYLAMFLISEDIGYYCLWNCKWNEKDQGLRLLFSSVALWTIHFALVNICDVPVSRRSTNCSFVAWTLAHNMSMLLLIWLSFYIMKLSTKSSKPSPIFDAVNRHGLVVFMLANLMTGLVNITINTLEVGDEQALLIIFCYLIFVGTSALLLDWVFSSKKEKLKVK